MQSIDASCFHPTFYLPLHQFWTSRWGKRWRGLKGTVPSYYRRRCGISAALAETFSCWTLTLISILASSQWISAGSWAKCYPHRRLWRHTSITHKMNYWRCTTPTMILTWVGIGGCCLVQGSCCVCAPVTSLFVISALLAQLLSPDTPLSHPTGFYQNDAPPHALHRCSVDSALSIYWWVTQFHFFTIKLSTNYTKKMTPLQGRETSCRRRGQCATLASSLQLRRQNMPNKHGGSTHTHPHTVYSLSANEVAGPRHAGIKRGQTTQTPNGSAWTCEIGLTPHSKRAPATFEQQRGAPPQEAKLNQFS